MTPTLLAALLLFADSTPRDGETILFVGDSITQAGDYVAFVEAYILACRSSDYFRVINVGKSSETVSGTSEPDHHPPRPCLHDRFARDVAAFKPNIVVACYGMNDGNYFPFDEERFEKFKAGINRLIDRVFKETPARALVLLTPPSFDASRDPKPPEDGKSYGYKHPSPHYDGVLRKYSDWLLTKKSEKVTVVDVHRAFKVYQRDTRSSLSPDAVHPNSTGHWLMAQLVLTEWKIRPKWAELTVDVQRPKGTLAWKLTPWGADLWSWLTPPIEPPIIAIVPFGRPLDDYLKNGLLAEQLFDQKLTIEGLPEEISNVHAFGGVMPEVKASELKAGVSLLKHRAFSRALMPFA